MSKVIVSGASGLIGSSLVSFLRTKGLLPSRMVRTKPVRDDSDIFWDPANGKLDPSDLEGVTTVIHLAGKNIVAGRWNSKLKEEVLNSRVKSTKLLCESLAQLSCPPKLLISASAIGYYGTKSKTEHTEQSKPGHGFLADVCVKWEAETQPAASKGIRVVHLRLGMVLSTRGGALSMMLPAFKMGVAGVLGDGSQYISWVTLDDVIRIVDFIIDNDTLIGPVNAVAPNPVTNRQFTKALGHVLRRPTICKVPKFALRIALGEMADEMPLASGNVIPRKLIDNGFRFRHSQLDEALEALLQRKKDSFSNT